MFWRPPRSAKTYKKRLIFHLLSHQYHQQFEQKYENKREKSGSNVENSLELMLSQCCESSLTNNVKTINNKRLFDSLNKIEFPAETSSLKFFSVFFGKFGKG